MAISLPIALRPRLGTDRRSLGQLSPRRLQEPAGRRADESRTPLTTLDVAQRDVLTSTWGWA